MLAIFLITLSLSAPDSLRMEVIDGKQYVIHQVGEKETLYSLARRYGATVNTILEQNPAAGAGALEIGQILKIPYTAKPKSHPPVTTADGVVHKVTAGETLFAISRQYGVTVDEIKAWNNLKETSLSAGQELLVKKHAGTTIATSGATTGKTHTVTSKETLFSISRLYAVSVQDLRTWNSLATDDVKIGQVLLVGAPVPGATTTPAVTTTTSTTTTTTPIKTESTIRISEGVNGSSEIKESGTAELIEGSAGNRKYLAQHRTIPQGTILKIRNLQTSQEVFVRVTGAPAGGDPATIIWISKSAYDRLGVTDPKFRAEITYYK